MTIAPFDEVITDFPGLFVQQTTTVAAVATTYGTIVRNYRPWWPSHTITPPTISAIELYINNLFVNPEIHDIFIRRVGFSLIRVYRKHQATILTASSNELLSQLKWPIETMLIGFQPTVNNTTSYVNYWRDWHRMGKTFDQICDKRTQGMYNIDTAAALGGLSNLGQIVPDTYVLERPTVTTVGLQAHGIRIYDTFSQTFFSSYVPFTYGGANVRPAADPGVMVINFALFPGSYQPSGHINVSRARELYLQWTSNYIGSTTSVTLTVIGIALNFLLVSDGSAVLRYST